jgi:hypothetical protein
MWRQESSRSYVTGGRGREILERERGKEHEREKE